MPVSGLVLTIFPASLIEIKRHLAPDPRFTPGELQGHHLPVVFESETLEEHRTAWRWLEELPYVCFVELAYHDFSDMEELGTRPPPSRKGRVPPSRNDA